MNATVKYMIYFLCIFISSHFVSCEAKCGETKAPSNIFFDTHFWAGAVGGLLVHELGHVMVGMSYGGNPQLNNGSIVYPNSRFSRKASMRVSSAGFQAQWLLAEISFTTLKHHNNELHQRYYQGAIAMHLAISTAYLLRLKNMPTSDIYTASQTSHMSRNTLAWVIFLPAALDAYRLMGDNVPDWVSHISLGIKAAEVGYMWQF